MVDDGKKQDQMEEVQTVEPSTTNPSLKLKINLRDRQSIRKRHRSSSPANSSDSSSTHGSIRSYNRHHTTSAGSTISSSLKRNRKDESQLSPQPDTPPPSNGSPYKKNEIDERQVEVKKVRLGPGGASVVSNNSVTITEKRNKSTSSAGSVLPNNILLVDMNSGSAESEENDAYVSPPESPIEMENIPKNVVESKIEEQIQISTAKAVKRWSRDELERFVMEHMCLAIRERGITGELERKADAQEVLIDRYRRRTESLQKQVADLELVVRRFVQQSRNRNVPIAPPIKMTRSVGLQINLNSNSNGALQIASMLKKPNEVKPSVTVVSAGTSKSLSATMIKSPTQSISITSPPTLVSPNSNSLARVPVPPSFTMQSPDIASYVPQQAVPRYRSVSLKRPDEPSSPPKIATYVNITGAKAMPNSSLTTKLLKNSVNITPVAPSYANQRPQGSLNINPNSLARARSATTGDLSNSHQPIPASIPMARWSKVPSTRATTVNKVTLPGRPNVIDLTDEDLEKERAAASNNRVMIPNKHPTSSNVLPTNGMVRKVALKSTTLNGRNPLVTSKTNNNLALVSASNSKPTLTHPAPLPPAPVGPTNPSWKPVAPRPSLDIKRVANGIVLSWNMQGNLSNHADIASYQLFAYQEGTDPPPNNGSVWKRVGDVKALPLPMACTLTQFLEGHRYHFAVRAMDVHGRAGPYSEPGTIVLS